MRILPLAAGAIFLVGTVANVTAAPIGSQPTFEISSIVLVQEKKSDTVTQRVKRAWKDLTGYKFNVACPAFFPVNHRTCTETGKDRTEARGKCAGQNQFCLVSDAK